MSTRRNILILCTGNSARSQMAEGLLRRRVGERYEVHSAGTEPKGVNPLAVEAMREVGIDISGHRSKHLREFLGHLSIHHVLIVCSSAEASCPRIWPGALTRTAHSFDDPAVAEGTHDERLRKFREVRDEIAAWLETWLADLERAR